MIKGKDKEITVIATHTFQASHIEKLRNMSRETDIPMSALLKRALNKFFEESEKTEK
jgi:hypothetical protein